MKLRKKAVGKFFTFATAALSIQSAQMLWSAIAV